MTTQAFILSDVYQLIVTGPALITISAGTRVRIHIGTVLPPANAPFHPLELEPGTDRGFPYGGTETVYARRGPGSITDSNIQTKIAFTPAI